MLGTETEERTECEVAGTAPYAPRLGAEAETTVDRPQVRPSRLAAAIRIEWLGQTVASICWIVSVFAYGISSTGDWLQLCAASSWLIANIATLATVEAN
ncbi:MAG: hypothetical protein AAGF97_02570 [Planctomycetota bacterium]